MRANRNHPPRLADRPPRDGDVDGWGSICLRPEGHTGPHRWCRDDEVAVRLTPAGRAALYRSLQAELLVEVPRGG